MVKFRDERDPEEADDLEVVVAKAHQVQDTNGTNTFALRPMAGSSGEMNQQSQQEPLDEFALMVAKRRLRPTGSPTVGLMGTDFNLSTDIYHQRLQHQLQRFFINRVIAMSSQTDANDQGHVITNGSIRLENTFPSSIASSM